MGIGLALVCAVVTQLGFLFKHRGAALAPEVRITQPLRSARALFASRWFAIGMAIAAAAWLFHVAALALAPLSTVQAVLSTGVVILAVMSDRIFGLEVSRRQWAGVAMTAIGLTLLVLTLPSQHGSGSSFALPGLLAFEAAMLALGTLLIAAPRLGAPAAHHGVLLGASAGVLVRRLRRRAQGADRARRERPARRRRVAVAAGRRRRLGAGVPRVGARLPAGRGGTGDREHVDRREPDLHRRRHPRVRRRARSGNLARRPARVDTKAVRAWAKSINIELSSRGRIPADVVDQYRKAGN